MNEFIGPMDLLRGACIYGSRSYELGPTIADRLGNVIAVDIRPWNWGRRFGHEAIAAGLFEWVDLDLLAEGIAAGLGLPPGTVGSLLSRFYRMTPSPTFFGLSGFLDNFETEDAQMRGVAERVREVAISLSSLGRGEELPDEGPAFIDLSKPGWRAPRCLLYAGLLRRFIARPPKAPLLLSGLEVFGRSKRLWGLVEGLEARVPLLAFCEERPGAEFFTLVEVRGSSFEMVRGKAYRSRGVLRLERARLEEGGVRGDLVDSRDAYMVLKALEKDESTAEGLKGYLPMVAVDEVLFCLEEEGYVERDGRFVRITERGLEHLGRLEEVYG